MLITMEKLIASGIKALFIITLLAHPFLLSAQNAESRKGELKKLVNILARERVEFKKEPCKDCSYFITAKIFLNKKFQTDSILLSYSTPASMQGLSKKLMDAKIDWRKLLNYPTTKRIIILPIWYITERTDGSALLNSAEALQYDKLFQFSDGYLNTENPIYYCLPPEQIFGSMRPSESRMVLDSSDFPSRPRQK